MTENEEKYYAEVDPAVEKIALLQSVFNLYCGCGREEIKKDLARHIKTLCEELAVMFTCD